MMDDYDYHFDPKKNQWLIANRGISFERIIALIADGKLLRVLEHPNRDKYPEQWLYEVDVGGYVYVVPVLRDGTRLVLKTVYPSRKATKHHTAEE